MTKNEYNSALKIPDHTAYQIRNHTLNTIVIVSLGWWIWDSHLFKIVAWLSNSNTTFFSHYSCYLLLFFLVVKATISVTLMFFQCKVVHLFSHSLKWNSTFKFVRLTCIGNVFFFFFFSFVIIIIFPINLHKMTKIWKKNVNEQKVM